MPVTRPILPTAPDKQPASEIDKERERQEYLEEAHVESTQYGVGRHADEDKPDD